MAKSAAPTGPRAAFQVLLRLRGLLVGLDGCGLLRRGEDFVPARVASTYWHPWNATAGGVLALLIGVPLGLLAHRLGPQHILVPLTLVSGIATSPPATPTSATC